MAQMRLRAATPEERSMYLYACELGLNPPKIHAQSLHTVGQGGIDLGVVISFSSPDCRLLDLFFEYSINDGDSWRPLVRDSDSPQRSWSAVVYGVRSHETVRVRAVLGDEFGPETAFTVREGIEAATEYLRAFTPIGRRPHIAPPRRPIMRGQHLNRSTHFTTGFSQAYHSSPDCPALRSGQSGVEWRGGTPAGVVEDACMASC